MLSKFFSLISKTSTDELVRYESLGVGVTGFLKNEMPDESLNLKGDKQVRQLSKERHISYFTK